MLINRVRQIALPFLFLPATIAMAVGGIVGFLLTAVFANQAINSGNTTGNGLLVGETHLFMVHLVTMIAVFVFAGTFVLLKITDLITPLRVSDEEEMTGLDLSQHGENL